MFDDFDCIIHQRWSSLWNSAIPKGDYSTEITFYFTFIILYMYIIYIISNCIAGRKYFS